MPDSPALVEVLERARAYGFVGERPLTEQIHHGRLFAEAARAAGFDAGEHGAPIVDLGSGGGLPGLVMADLWPAARFLLVEASARRAEFLSDAVNRCGWGSRVAVVNLRAEDLARDPKHRGVHSLVVSRSFGAPPVVAECAAGLLHVAGILVVSEPPVERRSADDSPETAGSYSEGRCAFPGRWPTEGLARVGMAVAGFYRASHGFQVLYQAVECPSAFPRRAGIPAKRPLYRVEADQAPNAGDRREE